MLWMGWTEFEDRPKGGQRFWKLPSWVMVLQCHAKRLAILTHQVTDKNIQVKSKRSYATTRTIQDEDGVDRI